VQSVRSWDVFELRPYLKISVGNRLITSLRDNPSSGNQPYYRHFEEVKSISFPQSAFVEIQVLHRGHGGDEDDIDLGTTVIDLEDRVANEHPWVTANCSHKGSPVEARCLWSPTTAPFRALGSLDLWARLDPEDKIIEEDQEVREPPNLPIWWCEEMPDDRMEVRVTLERVEGLDENFCRPLSDLIGVVSLDSKWNHLGQGCEDFCPQYFRGYFNPDGEPGSVYFKGSCSFSNIYPLTNPDFGSGITNMVYIHVLEGPTRQVIFTAKYDVGKWVHVIFRRESIDTLDLEEVIPGQGQLGGCAYITVRVLYQELANTIPKNTTESIPPPVSVKERKLGNPTGSLSEQLAALCHNELVSAPLRCRNLASTATIAVACSDLACGAAKKVMSTPIRYSNYAMKLTPARRRRCHGTLIVFLTFVIITIISFWRGQVTSLRPLEPPQRACERV